MKVRFYNMYGPYLLIMLAVFLLSSCNKDELYELEFNAPKNNEVNQNFYDSLPPIKHFYSQLEEVNTRFQFQCIVLLPDSAFQSSESPLPVLYLLHGKDSDFTGWRSEGNADIALSVAMARDLVSPMAIVLPQALNTYYVNGYQYDIPYEDYFFHTLIPYIEEKYNIGGCKENRWIAGNSMGGYGALYYSIKHNDYFSFCYAMSSRVTGPDSPIVLDLLKLTAYPQDILFFLDIGKSDSFLLQNINLYQKMVGYNSHMSLQVYDGGHNWTFWRSALERCLEQLGRFKH